jgi:hypothetical protein
LSELCRCIISMLEVFDYSFFENIRHLYKSLKNKKAPGRLLCRGGAILALSRTAAKPLCNFQLAKAAQPVKEMVNSGSRLLRH